MGRIKTQLLKRITNQLIRDHDSELKKDFEENKKVISELADIPSKKHKNSIAGYVTRKKKAQV